MSEFLDLPYELRQIIIDYVVYSRRGHPLGYDEDAEREVMLKFESNPACHGLKVCYETDTQAYMTTSYGLLGTSRQLKLETESILASKPLKYCIDVGLMEARSLWPTWTCLPAKSKVVDKVEATIQARGPGRPCFRSWRRGGGGGPQSVWMFYSLLQQFLDFGIQNPQFERDQRQSEGADAHYTTRTAIKTLSLDFLDANLSTVDSGLETSELIFPQHRSEDICLHCRRKCWLELHKPQALTAEALCCFLASYIHTLLRHHMEASYGSRLYKRIGKIEFYIRGSHIAEIDLGKWLVEAPNTWNGKDIASARRQMMNSRRKYGLAVPEIPQHTTGHQLWDEMWKSETEIYERLGINEE